MSRSGATIGPIYGHHNHGPALASCPNGDLLAVWFTCSSERNREMAQAASRLPMGASEWQPASPFFDVPDRNDPAPAMAYDGKETIYYFTGVSHGGEYKSMALVMRTSKDSGATWSRPRLVLPKFNENHMPSEPIIWLEDDVLTLAQDGPRTLWMTSDGGVTWRNPDGNIRGIHPGVVELMNGSLLGYGRGKQINGRMAQSISTDRGKSFRYSASPFPPIGGGQRLILTRLEEGPLLFASFADDGIMIKDRSGKQRKVWGLYAALSLDEGKTWPYKRLITDDGRGRPVGGTNDKLFLMSSRHAEPGGYLSVAQSPNGVIHLVTSRQHYSFNLEWLMTRAPPLRHSPVQVEPAVESFSGPDAFDLEGWAEENAFTGGFNGQGQYVVDSESRGVGINRILGRGSFELVVSVKDLQYNPVGKDTKPGFSVDIADGRRQSMMVRVEPRRLRFNYKESLTLDKQTKSARLKIVYDEKTRDCRIFYGLNGGAPIHELPESKAGLSFEEPLSETTNVALNVNHARVAIDHFEVRPRE